MKIRKECSYCSGSEVEWDMGDVLHTSCPGFIDDGEGNCKNFDPLEEDEEDNMGKPLELEIPVKVMQSDLVNDIICSIEEDYPEKERVMVMLDFVLDIVDNFGPLGDTELADCLTVTLLARKTNERQFACHECKTDVALEDRSLILFDDTLEPRCPYCGSADVIVK